MERDCNNCKYESFDRLYMPCYGCRLFDNWEPEESCNNCKYKSSACKHCYWEPAESSQSACEHKWTYISENKGSICNNCGIVSIGTVKSQSPQIEPFDIPVDGLPVSSILIKINELVKAVNEMREG